MSNLTDATFGELRGTFDTKESFMTGGYQTLRPRAVRQSDRVAPAWATSDEAVRKILLSAFPKLQTHAGQRERAGRWAEIIHLYFRLKMSSGQIATHTELKRKTVENTIASIRRVAGGRMANNRGPRGQRRSGRPKQVNSCRKLVRVSKQ